MPVNSVIVLYRPKSFKYGMYESEKAGKHALDYEESYKYNGVHIGILCDYCDCTIRGERWNCDECTESVDLCADCYYGAIRPVVQSPGHVECNHDMSHFSRTNLLDPPPKPEKTYNRLGHQVKRGNGSSDGGSTRLRSDEVWYCGKSKNQCRCGGCGGGCGPGNGCPCDDCYQVLISNNKINENGDKIQKGRVNGTGGFTGRPSDQVWYCGKQKSICMCEGVNKCNGICGPNDGCPCEDCFNSTFSSTGPEMHGGATRNSVSRASTTRNAVSHDDATRKPPDLGKCIEDGFKQVELLNFFLLGHEDQSIVTKHEAVSEVFCQDVKKRLAKDGKCPITSGHVRIPFGLTISGRIPRGGVTLTTRPRGPNSIVLACHMLNMRESLFMEYLDVYHGIPEIINAKRVVNHVHHIDNTWNMETHTNDPYTMQHFTEATNIIPDDDDVQELVNKASILMNCTQARGVREGMTQDEIDDIRVVVKHDAKSVFKSGTDVLHFSTMTSKGVLFPHVTGYDIAAIIPVTLELQLVSGMCDICTSPVQRMERLCENKHEMCNECIENWTSKGVRSCPFCRSPMFEHLFETRSSSMDFDRAFTRPEAFSLDKFIV